MVYVTRGLIDALLDMAAEAEPDSLSVVIASTPAGEFAEDLGVDPDEPVFTHFYLPDAGRALSNVFGMDLGTPVGRGRARFVTHPQGPLELTETDDLARIVLVGIPPWESDQLAAFDRGGSRLPLTVVDAEPPEESLAE